jgi:hypothetical protein
LIDNYMHLLAAPFIAIAVYYLLQIIANDTAEPVLVLMAFATGLVSDSIVSGITEYAEKTLARVLGKGDRPHSQLLRAARAAAPAAPTADTPPALTGSHEDAEAERLASVFIAKVEGKSDNGAADAERQEPS